MRRAAIPLATVLGGLALALAPSFACAPIVGTPLSSAPVNDCQPDRFPCDAYVVKGAASRPQCNIDEDTRKSRCDYGGPTYPYTIVVNVPDSSFYAPGRVFALTNNDLIAVPGAVTNRQCPLPRCVALPELVAGEGKYRVTAAAAAAVKMPLESLTSIPVRVELVPFAPGTTTDALTLGLPLAAVRTSSQMIQKSRTAPREVSYVDSFSVGGYQRIAYPQPPFDAFFPPAFSSLRVNEPFLDDFVLGVAAEKTTTSLDDEGGVTRTTTITRKEGLEGWQVWLSDHLTARRISSLKTLSGTTATVTLHTVGWSQATSIALREPIDVVISPPAGFVGVPRLESPIVNGGPFGFADLEVPPMQAPARFSGVVGQGDGPALTAVPSRLLFTSNGLRQRDGTSQLTLKYTTSVSTDEAGRFETVLPPGFYDVTIEPEDGTGFAKVKETLDTTVTTAKTFRPPPRTVAFGRAVLADGRPLSEAAVLALPAETSLVGRAVKPRPAQTRTDREGNFKFEVDQGQYNLMIDPQPGTDFPRVAQIRSFAGLTADVGEIVVAPPARLSFELKDPYDGNAIVRAVVRVFAELPGRGPPAIEMGRAMTDVRGKVEILLAQQAR